MTYSITSLIRKKRDGGELTDDEILRVVEGAASGDIPDYQLSAFLMAVYFSGMTARETSQLTVAMACSGARLDLSAIPMPKVDKHSTGGVGDKVSLILAPVVASFGIAVPMISGRGLGHTGGTADKLESIPGFRTGLSLGEIRTQIGAIGIAMAAQSSELAPADRKLYALRDVTATVESLPLLTASILSKKFAEGLDALVMDVKFGRGAFMRTLEDARLLAASIAAVCRSSGLPGTIFLTCMDVPLGRRIGNWLEVCEAVRVLRGQEEPPFLMEVALPLAGACIAAGGKARDLEEGTALARRAIADGSAYEKFLELVRRQGGDLRAVEHAAEPAPTEVVMGNSAGYVTAIDSYRLGLIAIELGAGRRTLEDAVAPQAGIVLHRHLGEHLERGEILCSVVECRAGIKIDPEEVRACFTVGEAPPEPPEMIAGVEEFSIRD